MEIADLWILFYKTKDLKLRNQLIKCYLGVVSYVIRKMVKIVNLPAGLEEKDLWGFGMVGLIQAVERFNPYRGVKFETYALKRVKGEIVDNLRVLGFVSRSTAQLIQERIKIEDKLEQTFLRQVTIDEIEREFGGNGKGKFLPTESRMLSLFDLVYGGRGDITFLDIIPLDDETDPTVGIERQELIFHLMKCIRELPEKKRLLVGFYYFEKLTFKEIGDLLGVTESRVSQVHTEILLELRRKVKIFLNA